LLSKSENILPEINKIVSNNGYYSDTSILSPNEEVLLKRLNPIISLIIPVLQEEKILAKTLSVYTPEIREKFNLEIIVSDGGSTDRTVEIAKKYADYVVLHSETRKQTIAEGRNKGAEVSKGDILIFINGDTIPAKPENFFQNIVDWISGKTDLTKSDALACPCSVEKEEIIFKDRIFYACHNFYVRLLNFIGLGMGRGECQIVKKDIFKKVGGYNPDIAAGEDFDLYRRIAKCGKISYAKNLKVFESPRRFRKYGYLRIIYSWTINSISVWFRGRSVSKVWEAVR
jgi:glycosyltransferase involved in cell wall biosynthesis